MSAPKLSLDVVNAVAEFYEKHFRKWQLSNRALAG